MDSSFSQTAHQTKQKGKRKGNKDVLFSSDDGFLGRLNVCLSLQKQYRDMLRSLKDGLGGSHNLSMTPSVLQPSKRSNITNSTSNLMSPSAAGSPLRLSFSQSKFMLTVDFCWLELIISLLCLSVVYLPVVSPAFWWILCKTETYPAVMYYSIVQKWKDNLL